MERNIQFTGSNPRDLDGQGLLFNDGSSTKHLIMREGNLWSNTNINLTAGLAVMFNNTVALKQNELGSTVIKSNLREVGILKSLRVAGRTALADVVTVDPDFKRVGINSDSPNAALSIIDNGVEIVIGSHKNDTAKIGTYTADDITIVTDNTERMLFSRSGEIVVGHPKHKNGVFKVNGKIIADSIETENRSIKSLEFGPPEWHTEPYQIGLFWKGTSTRSLTLDLDPDRLLSTESIDLAVEKYYSIDRAMVISKNSLGATVTNSSLTRLGLLESLNVVGPVKFEGTGQSLTFNNGLTLSGPTNSITFDSNAIKATNGFAVEVDGEPEISVSSNGNISIGNRHNTNRTVSVFGQLSVGVRHPDPGVSFVTVGTMSFSGKKFITGDAVPTIGQFNKGDICWNSDPKTSDYVGWVCVMAGDPGQWEPFGGIGR